MHAETSAITPASKLENDFYDWHKRHDTKVRQAASGSHDLAFIGDSITHLFEGDANLPGRGENVWAQYYASRRALNLGFGWDRTQNVLWRIDHGELAGQKPRLAVLLIGTNNLTGTNNAPTNTPSQIAAGIAAIHARIAALAPRSRLLLLGLLPRGTPDDPIRQRIIETNALLADYADAKRGDAVTFLDLGSRFLDADGRIPKTLMDDGVHPTQAGYQIWAEAIEPRVVEAIAQ
jgi:lysophospholipase L1-like esterase